MGNNPARYDAIKKLTLQERNKSLEIEKTLILDQVIKLKMTEQKIEEITSLNVIQSVSRLNAGKLTSEQLLTALAYRTITISEKFNLFTYLYYEKALKIAQICDEKSKQSKKRNITLQQMLDIKNSGDYHQYFPPLFGIPISVKDVYHLEGRLATIGLLANANKKHEQSTLIKCFRNAGMIPFVQTNVPQFGMTMQTSNNLWGRSMNPWNIERSPAGSSGGQGGMISARCSMLGVGSDIGGSIRIPSDHCGVFGLKPNSKRISNTYHARLSKAFQSYVQTIGNCIGPLGRSAEDLALLMMVATNQQNYQGQDDPYTRIVPFNAKTYHSFKNSKNRLRIGYYDSLQDLQPSPASRRAVQQVIQILQQSGHEVIRIKMPNEKQILQQYNAEYMSVGGKNYRQMLDGQQPVQQYKGMFFMGELTAPGRFFMSTITKWTMYRVYFYFLQKKPFKQVIDYQRHIGQIAELRAKWIKYWREQNLDLVITPGYGCQAYPLKASQKLSIAVIYTSIWNALDMAVGAIPVTKVRQNEQVYLSKFDDAVTAGLKQICKNSMGLPVGVQIVGLPYQEEKVLGLMSFLEDKIKFYEKNGFAKVQK